MLNIIMMVPDTLSKLDAKNSPDWNLLVVDSEIVSAAQERISATRQMNRNSDEQIVKSKELMSQGISLSGDHKEVSEPA